MQPLPDVVAPVLPDHIHNGALANSLSLIIPSTALLIHFPVASMY